MAFQVSPGVQVKEIDATGVIPAVSTSIGGFTGAFNWGPVEEITLVSSEDNMASIFSTPADSDTAKYFLTAASFLKYGNALKVVRTVGTAARNANGGGQTNVVIKNEADYDNASLGSAGEFVAKYPGALGNSLRVDVCYSSSNNQAFDDWGFKGEFDSAPTTSDSAKALGYDGVTSVGGVTRALANDELHIVVYDGTGEITGTPGTLLEKFAYLSQASDAKDSSGSSVYYADAITNRSKWVSFAGHLTATSNAGSTFNGVGGAFAVNGTSVATDILANGVDDNTLEVADIQRGLDLFNDSETVDVNLLFAYPDTNGSRDIGNYLISVANGRKDCMAFISPPIEDTTQSNDPLADVLAYVNDGVGITSSSYASIDSGAVYVYDKYNDVYRWIGAAGLTAGLCANTDQVADAWFSPAGVNRGQLRGVTKLAFNPTQAQRDSLYKARVNPIVSFPGQGTMLYGDKTLLSRPSAFDRINVRRLFITLEKAISTAAKAQLFEFNDEFTRSQFRNMVEPFLRDVKGRRGLTDFLVTCDETNNTGQVVDSNSFVADIYIKPARSINFITLNFIATRTGVDFSEVSGG